MASELNQTSVDFFLIDLDTGLTFMDVARVTSSEETARRNHANARKVYGTVLDLMQKVALTAQQREQILLKLTLLKERLRAAGSLDENC